MIAFYVIHVIAFTNISKWQMLGKEHGNFEVSNGVVSLITRSSCESLRSPAFCGPSLCMVSICREVSSILSTKKGQEELAIPEAVTMVESGSEGEKGLNGSAMEVDKKPQVTYLVREYLLY